MSRWLDEIMSAIGSDGGPVGVRIAVVGGGSTYTPELNQDEIGAVEGGVGVGRQDQPARPVEAIQHPPGETADDFDPIGIRIEQDQLVDGYAIVAESEALDQFRGIRAAATDNRDPDAHRPSTDPVIDDLVEPS